MNKKQIKEIVKKELKSVLLEIEEEEPPDHSRNKKPMSPVSRKNSERLLLLTVLTESH